MAETKKNKEDPSLDPFVNAMTIASACNKVYRRLFLKPNKIGVVPHGGYRRNDKQSIIGLKWLKWLSVEQNISIQHARNGPENKVQQYKVDGYCKEQNTVYEFHGCN